MSDTVTSTASVPAAGPDAPRRIGPFTAPDRATVLRWLRDNGVYAAIVVLLLFNLFFSKRFLSTSNLDQQLVLCTRVIVVALGMALVIGTEGIDLSVGAVIGLAGALLVEFRGVPGVFAILLTLCIGGLVGLLNGTLVAYLGVQPIVATLAFLFAGRSIAILLVNGQGAAVTSKTVTGIASGSPLGIHGLIWAAAVPVLLVAFLVRKTMFGRRVVAIGDNVRAAYLSGVPVRRTLILVYIVSGVLAAWAGVMETANSLGYASAQQAGLNYELYAITAVVVGGTPLSGGRVRVVNTVFAAIFMQLLSATLIFHNASTAISQMVTAVVIIVAVYYSRVRARS